MKKEDKSLIIEQLKEKFAENNFFYITDASGITVEQVNKFRGMCYEKEVEMRVVKNTLVQKALEAVGTDGQYDELYSSLKGPTALMFSQTANLPAKLIEEFRKTNEKPLVKAAYIDSSIFLGDESLKGLAALKSKEELIGDVIALLQSPAKNVISALKSGGSTIAGLVKALEEKGA